MNVTKCFRRVPQFEDAYRDLFKHELHKLPNRNMIALFDGFDNVIGRPFDQMTDAHKKILAAQAGRLSTQAQAIGRGAPLLQQQIDATPQPAAQPQPAQPTPAAPQIFDITAPGLQTPKQAPPTPGGGGVEKQTCTANT